MRHARASHVAHVMARLRAANGAWVEWDAVVRDGWDRNAIYQLIDDGVIERRATTLTDDRSPGWLARALAAHGFENPWSAAADAFESALRIVATDDGPSGASPDGDSNA